MGDVAHTVTERLFQYGILGVVCVLFLAGLVYLQRRSEKQEERHREEMRELRQYHQAKVEELTGKMLAMADRQAAAIESMVKGRRGA